MIKENILNVKKRISSICSRNKLDADSITVVVVSKGRSTEQIEEAIGVGIIDIGENRVQEAIGKYNKLQAPCCPAGRPASSKLQAVKWHMVGHLQTNKVKDAVKIFDLIHSVNSLRLAREISKQAAKINKVQDVLIEVNTSGEATKSGLKPDAVISTINEMVELAHVNIRGLMTIAPMVDRPEKTRPYFRQLRELKDEICLQSTVDSRLSILSMGMTDDFEIAIEEGSNMVRLGRAIFES